MRIKSSLVRGEDLEEARRKWEARHARGRKHFTQTVPFKNYMHQVSVLSDSTNEIRQLSCN